MVYVSTEAEFLSACKTYNIIHKLNCIKFADYFKYVASSTWSHGMSLFCNSSRVNAFRYSYFIDAPFVWNKLPSAVINARTYSAFKFRFNFFCNDQWYSYFVSLYWRVGRLSM